MGAVYTCPNRSNEGTPFANPARYALAGHALIKNLTPARYDVIAHPGAARDGAGEVWWQTETLEGTPAQDAFTGINEPTYFQEFGPPGPHTTIGFVNPAARRELRQRQQPGRRATPSPGGSPTQHMAPPVGRDAVGLGQLRPALLDDLPGGAQLQGGTGAAIAAAQCDRDGSFTLTNVPDGNFERRRYSISGSIRSSRPWRSPCRRRPDGRHGDHPVLSWFTQYDQNIYLDLNKNGVYEEGEPGITNVPLTLRYRNGAPSNRR